MNDKSIKAFNVSTVIINVVIIKLLNNFSINELMTGIL